MNPEHGGLAAADQLTKGGFEPGYLRAAMTAGACGFLLKGWL